MNSNNAAVAKKMLDAFMAGDLEGVIACIHPDCVIHEPDHVPYSGEWHGPSGFRDLVGEMLSAFDFRILNYQLYESADLLTMRANIGVQSRNSGRYVETQLVELYRVRDEQIIDMDVFYKDAMEIHLLAKGE